MCCVPACLVKIYNKLALVVVNCYLQWERKVLCFTNVGKVTVMLHEKNQGVAVPLGQITGGKIV